MALPLGKFTILVGAGIVGSVLAKEGRLPNVSDFFSGAFKIALRQIRQDNSTSSTPKPHNDSLLQQVTSLRQELQLLTSNRSVTIMTSSGSGSSRYTIVIVVVVMGYGYIWWKGWKLPELMFATRRSLSDACGSVSKQLESVYTSISATKRHLTSRIGRVDTKIDDCVDNTAATRDEVSEIRGKVRTFGEDVQSVHLVVQSLETKINRIEGRQNETNYGVGKLVAFVRSIETSRAKEQIEAPPSSSSRPALELPSVTSSARAGSLPPSISVEPSSPSASSVSPKRPLHGAVSASGLKELGGISDVVEVSSESNPHVSNAVFSSEQRSNENSGFGSVYGRKFPGIGASFLTRSRSAMQSFKLRPGSVLRFDDSNECIVQECVLLSVEAFMLPNDTRICSSGDESEAIIGERLWNPVVSCSPATLMNRSASTRLLTGRDKSIRVCRLTHTHAGWTLSMSCTC